MRRAALLLSLLPFVLSATELAPWLGNDKEIELRVATGYQTYSRLEVGGSKVSVNSDDFFLNLSGAISPSYPWSAELELNLIKTPRNDYGVEALKATGRYLWMNDLTGAPVSLATGMTIGYSPDDAVNDFSIPHHGNCELEAHIAIGKEHAHSRKDWEQRYWALLGVGYGFSDSPWIHYHAQFEQNIRQQHQVHLFLAGRYGFGSKDIDPTKPFKGYANIDHHHVDTGFAYQYTIDYIGALKGSFAYRIHTHNGPEEAAIFLLTFLFPFGL